MPVHATLRAIEYYLPEAELTTEDLAKMFPDWSVEKIDSKTGIHTRHIAAPEQCSSDLATAAAQKLFASGVCAPEQIDFVLLCTQSPDYFLPTTACLVQDRLGIPTHAGALDFNLGCSGFVYGLGLAEGLIASGQAQSILLITAETYSKFMDPEDRRVRTIFGDAAAAIWITAEQTATPRLGPFLYGTDGKGAPNLIVPTGGMRKRSSDPRQPEDCLYMSGPDLFNFTLSEIPNLIRRTLEKSELSLDQVNLFIFHQANQYMLNHLRKRLQIPEEKFLIFMRSCGNTVSSTIPIALKNAAQEGKIKEGERVMLVGYGVGYSWGAAMWTASALA